MKMRARDARRIVDARERCPVCQIFARTDRVAIVIPRKEAVGLCFRHRHEQGRYLAWARSEEFDKQAETVGAAEGCEG